MRDLWVKWKEEVCTTTQTVQCTMEGIHQGSTGALMNNPCKTKKFFDTEFEATIAAAKASHDLRAELVPYPCGRHWHIANKERKLRSRVRPHNRTYCDVCQTYMKPGRWDHHVVLPGHRRKAQEQARV